MIRQVFLENKKRLVRSSHFLCKFSLKQDMFLRVKKYLLPQKRLNQSNAGEPAWQCDQLNDSVSVFLKKFVRQNGVRYNVNLKKQISWRFPTNLSLKTYIVHYIKKYRTRTLKYDLQKNSVHVSEKVFKLGYRVPSKIRMSTTKTLLLLKGR